MAWPSWAIDLWARVQPYADRLAVWRGYEQELQTLAIYGIGIAVYTALVFAFYQNLSRRQPFHLKVSDRPGWLGRMGRLAERALVFPLTSFLYFAVLAVSLFVLAKSQSTQAILLIAMAVVVGVRVTVYLSEAMSNDLAKLVPLSLLAVTLVDPGYLSLGLAWSRLLEAVTLWPLLGRYFLLFIALEAVFASGRWTYVKVGEKARAIQARRKKEEPVRTLVVEEAPPAAAPPKTR
jgi:hypothetical protein